VSPARRNARGGGTRRTTKRSANARGCSGGKFRTAGSEGNGTGGHFHTGIRGLAIPTISAANAIAGIPDTLREELLARFNDVVLQYRRGHWESATLNAGKFCEVVYTVLRGRADRQYPPRAEKPPNMVRACQKLEQLGDTVLPRALRIQIPRVLLSIYEIRNNRGTGHAGSEIDPNRMDAEYVLHACQWILADLVRAFHQLAPAIAREVVEALAQRAVPLIWEVGNGVRRVLDPEMGAADRVLVLLYAATGAVDETTLREWSEYKNSSRFREEILADLHARALLHYDQRARTVVISPPGQQLVERELLGDRVLTP
jgi:hypothetical protein